MTIENPTFCLAFYLTGVHFRGELQHVGHVGEQKIKCRPIRIRETAGELYDRAFIAFSSDMFPNFYSYYTYFKYRSSNYFLPKIF